MALSVPPVFSISSRMRITMSSISSVRFSMYSLPPTGSVVLVAPVFVSDNLLRAKRNGCAIHQQRKALRHESGFFQQDPSCGASWS